MKQEQTPLEIVSGEGCYLTTKDGRRILDAVSSWWVNLHGHSHPFIAQSIAEQAAELEHVIFAGFTHKPAIDLANNLLKILPDNFTKIFFSDDGSTSVEVALKMALQYWFNLGIKHKTKIIAFRDGYHGDTFGAMSVAGKNSFNTAFQEKMFDVHFITTPENGQIEQSLLEFEQLAKNDDIAAFIFEPLVQGASGMRMHKPEDLDKLLQIAKQNDIICIADEVMTGFGRTGNLFAIDYLVNKPDLICLSKGITGGFLPLGVTAASQRIYDAFYDDDKLKTFFHGHSYTANPIACAAANASYELLVSPKCRRQIQMITESHKEFLLTLKDNKYIKNARSVGTIVAFELEDMGETSYFHSIRDKIYTHCLEQNVLLRPLGNVIYTMPPYCITKVELERVYEVMVSCTDLLKN